MLRFRKSVRGHILPVTTFLIGIVLGQVMIHLPSQVFHPVPQSILHGSGEREREPTLILVITYMRSGSTLTGDILQHAPGAFYVFEPLRLLVGSENFTYLNGTHRQWKGTLSGREEHKQQLAAWFRCDLGRVAPHTPFMKVSLQTKPFHSCGEQSKGKNDTITRCLPSLVRACKQARLRVLKTIRVKMEEAVELAERLPGLRLLHLVRDPRGLLTSRQVVNPDIERNPTEAASKLCQQMAEDLAVARRHAARLGSRYKMIRYEDIAINPLAATRELYEYVGMEVPPDVYGYVYCITRCGKGTEKYYNTKRTDSLATASAWRTKAKAPLLAAVQQSQTCQHVLQQCRYRSFKDPASLSNMSVSFSL